MAEYTPDPKFYDRQINAANKELKKYTNASYNTARRGYVVDGRVLSQEQLDAGIANINDKIASLEADKKKFGKYGPDYGEQAQSNALGEQFIQLYDAASAIEVTDFDSSLQSVKAWKAVENFVKQNKGIVVAVDRTAIIEGERGKSVRGTIRVAVDPTKDPTFKESITNNVKNAVDVATEKTEEGTIESREVIKGSGAAATRSTQKTVINPVELERRQKALDTEVAVVTAPPKVAPAVTAAGKSTTQTGMTDEQKESMRRRNKVGGGFGATAPATPATPEPPKVPGGVTQRTGRGRVLPSNWEAKFREMFPGQAWYLDVDPAKYPDVKKIVQDAVINRAWETPEAQARFLEQFKGSSFYKELQSTQKIRQVKAVVGDLGFDTVPFNQFLTKAMNLGWDGDTLKFEAYKEAFRKDDAGAYVNPTAVERVRKSNDYLSVSNIGKAFFSTVSDETVQRTLMGDMTNEDVQRQQRELAKTKYGHLAPLLDQGLTLMDIGDTFRTTASQILEKDPNTIDMSQADYEVALNFGEPGQKRVMTNGEWERLLRTDRRYGWTKTENAKAEARQFVDNMAKAFGRVI